MTGLLAVHSVLPVLPMVPTLPRGGENPSRRSWSRRTLGSRLCLGLSEVNLGILENSSHKKVDRRGHLNLEQFICLEGQSSSVRNLLLQQVREDIRRKMMEERIEEDKVWLVVVGEKD